MAFRVLDLIEAVLRDPFTAIGKPEPLKYVLAGAWSRRVTEEHRLVYVAQRHQVDLRGDDHDRGLIVKRLPPAAMSTRAAGQLIARGEEIVEALGGERMDACPVEHAVLVRNQIAES